MKVIYGIGRIKNNLKRPVVTIGIFDGVHRGHQQLIKEVTVRAARLHGTSVVLTFDPHPVSVLRPKNSLPLLLSLEHRLRFLDVVGVDVCIAERFSRNFANVAPEEFIRRLLLRKVRPYEVIVGEGFTFGRNSAGDVALLRSFGVRYNFTVREIAPVVVRGRRISSTWIRRFIKSGNLRAASRFLGRPVSVFGKVVSGKGRGRELGFPTINVYPQGEILPPRGVYAARVTVGGQRFEAMAFIGLVHHHKKSHPAGHVVEAHLFNFKRNLYNKNVEIELIKKIRETKIFPSDEQLARQISRDELAVKRFFRKSA